MSLYVCLDNEKELQDYLVKVVSFNAHQGSPKPVLSCMNKRAKDPEFLEKLLIFENEKKCVLAFLKNLRKEPVYVRSCYPCTNMEAVLSQPQFVCDGFSGQCCRMYIWRRRKSGYAEVLLSFHQ